MFCEGRTRRSRVISPATWQKLLLGFVRMEESWFSKGMAVEVCSDDQGLRGAWFVAEVVRSTSKRKKVLVEYKTLMADERGSKPLREFVDEVNLRPIPPREPRPTFKEDDDVDAYHNDGWWEGVVITVFDNNTYLVYFRGAKEELVFPAYDLRIHREWRGADSWLPPMDPLPNQYIGRVGKSDALELPNLSSKDSVDWSETVGPLPSWGFCSLHKRS